MPEALVDQEARQAVRDRLDETLFLEAGAGSGKTSCLVDRFEALVESGVPAASIAAITFTERAAAELADRVRQRLQEKAPRSPRCAAALGELDRAAIGTLHSFARRICAEHAIEAGLPPRIEVADEIASEVAFARRWEEFLDTLMDDPGAERPLRLFLAMEGRTERLRDLAESFGDNWDLLRPGQPDPVVPTIDIEAICTALETVAKHVGECKSGADLLVGQLEEAASLAATLRCSPDEDTILDHLSRARVKGRVGRASNWGGQDRLSAVQAELAAAYEVKDDEVAALKDACLRYLAGRIARFTLEGAEHRRSEGNLEFHDLLVLARRVLRDPAQGRRVRAEVAARYQRLLLDEFQDTDPIQVELAALIALGDRPLENESWEELEVKPGQLFFVGDPKQSIYRFRRADIAMFMAARQRYAGGKPLQLETNFRSGPAILAWVNQTFSALISEEEGCQPPYVPLVAHRPGPPVGPPVSCVGAVPALSKTRADVLREFEARQVAAAVHRVIEEGWSVWDGGAANWRPACAGDVCILIPARTSLPFLEAALEEAGIPFRVETSSLVYASRVIRDLMAVARSVDDPSDELSVVTALRSSACGCGDDDLYRWRFELGGTWAYQAPLPEGGEDHPVGRAMAWLADLHRRRMWTAPSELLAQIVADRRMYEAGFVARRPRDVWRRLRFVLDQARAWQDAGGSTLRSYLTWVQAQAREGARVVETVLPETDEDSVRVMTIHGAKGLEFPVTVVSGLTTQARSGVGGVSVRYHGDGTWDLNLGQGLSTSSFEAGRPRDEQMDDAERRRLLYVAATRARDHLIVSLARAERDPCSVAKPTSAELLWAAGPALVDVGGDLPERSGRRGASGPEKTLVGAADFEAWKAGHRRMLAEGGRRLALSATGYAEELARLRDPGLEKEPRDLELPAWQKGRYGTAVGRAVHATLQELDLGGDPRLEAVAAAQAAAEGVLGQEGTIARLARSALASSVVRRAATLPHWKETYVGAELQGVVVEGYVDLMFRQEGGLVLVDYKTDAWGTEGELDAKVGRYAPQLAAYAAAMEAATGEAVTEAVLVFLRVRGPGVERKVPDLRHLTAALGRRLPSVAAGGSRFPPETSPWQRVATGHG